MHDASWARTGSATWLVTSRPEAQPVVAGITFAAGTLHQPTEHLGVANLLAAWLTTSLTRPVEALDPAALDPPEQVAFSLGQTESSLVVVGTAAAVGATLGRVERVLAGAGGADLDGSLRDRARTYGMPLQPWSSHLVARWPGHRPHLAALGPLALDTIDVVALDRFVTERFAPASRVYWTNDPSLVDEIGLPEAARAPVPVAPAGWREGPGCVVQRNAGELFSVALPPGPATHIALSLLARILHRRMVEFEPLASDVRLNLYGVGGGIGLACCDADLLPGKDDAARAAVIQTLEDLAAGSVAPEEIDRVRQAHAQSERSAAPHEPPTMLRLVHRQLQRGDSPTPEAVADELERTDDARVLEALEAARRQLLVAVPDQEASKAPFPMAERVAPRDAEGRWFRNWMVRARSARCSPRRVALVEPVVTGNRLWSVTRQVTRSSVDFDEVVLRLDAGDQRTTLVDEQLFTVRLVWGAYRKAAALRELVDRHTRQVPVVRQRPDPEWPRRLAAAVKQRRRRVAFVVASFVAMFGVLVALSVLSENTRSRTTVREVDGTATVRLTNGTALGIAGGPELIRHYDTITDNVYAVLMRMCAGDEARARRGDPRARNYFGADKFQLTIGELTAPRLPQPFVPERPGPRGDYLDTGECASGWLLFRLPGPIQELPPPALRYTNITGDRVTWRLPATAAASPLSNPCPTTTTNDLGFIPEQPLAGCPEPDPSR